MFSTYSCLLAACLESEVHPCLPEKGAPIVIKTALVMRKDGPCFLCRISLVAHNSTGNHGSSRSITNVFKCVITLRHPHLWSSEEEENDRNTLESEHQGGLSEVTACP